MTSPSRIHRPAVATTTALEYKLVVDLQVANATIAEQERKIDRLRQEASVHRDWARQLHPIIADLRAELWLAKRTIADLDRQLGHKAQPDETPAEQCIGCGSFLACKCDVTYEVAATTVATPETMEERIDAWLETSGQEVAR